MYLQNLEYSLFNGIKLVQLRSKNMEKSDYMSLAEKILSLVHSYGGKLLLNGDETLLSDLNVDGIHFPSHNYLLRAQRPINDKYFFSVACHNKAQLIHAERINADFAVLCPVFATPSSPMGKPLGWHNFSKTLEDSKLPIYALGGLSHEDYVIANMHGACGVAAKRGLWGLKKPIPS